MDIVVTIAAIGTLIFAFSVGNWLISVSFKAIANTRLQQFSANLNLLQQTLRSGLLASVLGLCLLVGGLNGFLIYQGQPVLEFYREWLQRIPPEFWIGFAIALFQCISLLLLVKISLPYLRHGLDWVCQYAQNSDQLVANDESIHRAFAALKRISSSSIWLLALILCANFLQLPAIFSQYLTIALKAYLAISIGQLVVKATSVLIDTLDALSLRLASPDNWLRYYERFQHLVPALKKTLEYVLYVIIAKIIVREIEPISWLAEYADEIVQMLGIYFLCGVVIEFANILLEDLVLKTENLTSLQHQRRLTIIPLFKSVMKYTIYFAAAVYILKLLGIDPGPILAGAGIVGIAIGFGAQNLINDVVCGFFILFENYYLVGDYIEAGKEEERFVEGTVEAIELRTTHIRHPDGQLQIIRNGEMGSIVNYSKQYTYAKVDVPIPASATLDDMYALIAQIGQTFQAECPDVIEATQVDGLEALSSETLVLRTLTRVKPGKHLNTQRLLRAKLKQALDQQFSDRAAPQKT
ncbi:MAG: mechanosensitive ion channel family protein [Leptolyngbyaceae cyanobacterium bins.349]|nr:mechanosensitive ion channel family protein [Leptolyngbyaceae cyanobacterium bins.349]